MLGHFRKAGVQPFRVLQEVPLGEEDESLEEGAVVDVTIFDRGELLDVTGDVQLPEGREMVMPGDNVALEVELITEIAMERELRFAIREGGRTVGAGVVTEVVE